MDANRWGQSGDGNEPEPVYWLKQYHRFAVVSELADGIMHEINNPVMGIMNYAQLLEEMLRDSGNADCETFAKEISNETERLLGLVKSSFFFVGRQVCEVSEFEVSEAFERIYEVIKTTLRHYYIDYECHVDPSLPSLHCCEQQFSTAVLSLVLNSVEALNAKYPDASESKMMKVVCERETDTERGNSIAIMIVDWGEGFGGHGFEEMVRPGYTTRKGHPGMGLSFVDDFVAACGGEMIFEHDNETTTVGMVVPVGGQGGKGGI